LSKLYINLNGEFFLADAPVLYASNRAFRYGDSVFESIRVINGEPIFLNEHFERLKNSMQILGFEPSLHFTYRNLFEQILEIIERNNIKNGGRIRLTVFRNDGGYYTPDTNEKSYLIECTPLSENLYNLNQAGFHIDLYTKIKKNQNVYASLKTGNALMYVMAANYKKEAKLDECIILNQNDRICEAISSNIFLYKSGTLYTPSLSEGCLDGIMRGKIIELAKQLNIRVIEEAFTPTNLLQADEIFLTNVISGIRWVISYKQKRYFNTMAKKIVEELNRQICVAEDSNINF
jgi:branched-chain amino acid aminotransferase